MSDGIPHIPGDPDGLRAAAARLEGCERELDVAAGAGAADGTMPGLVVEPETLPDGRSITYFTAGDSRR